jgi:hypothetical protein
MEVMFVVVREQQVTADLMSEVPLTLSKYQVGGRAGAWLPSTIHHQRMHLVAGPPTHVHAAVAAAASCCCSLGAIGEMDY